MTIFERRAAQLRWETGEPRVRYRMPVVLAKQRVARAESRKAVWWLSHPLSLGRLICDTVEESTATFERFRRNLAETVEVLTLEGSIRDR